MFRYGPAAVVPFRTTYLAFPLTSVVATTACGVTTSAPRGVKVTVPGSGRRPRSNAASAAVAPSGVMAPRATAAWRCSRTRSAALLLPTRTSSPVARTKALSALLHILSPAVS